MNSHIKTNYEVETNFIFNYGQPLRYEDRNFRDARWSYIGQLSGTVSQINLAKKIRESILKNCKDVYIKSYLSNQIKTANFWINARKYVPGRIFLVPEHIESLKKKIIEMENKAEAIFKMNNQNRNNKWKEMDEIMLKRKALREMLDEVLNGNF